VLALIKGWLGDNRLEPTPKQPDIDGTDASALPPNGGSLGSGNDGGSVPGVAPPSTSDDKTVISSRSGSSNVPPPLAIAAPTIGESLVGKRLEHYDLVEYVGGGGMGAVFRAIDTRLGRTVAVKVMSRDSTDEETIRRFQNEAQSAARLDHPNIARVYYVGEDRGWNFIVFEFIRE
jgi:serine/threonine-protein kinase